MKSSKEDIIKLENRIKVIRKLALKFIFGYIVLAVIGYFIPLGFLPKAGGRFHGKVNETLPEQIGVENYIIVVIVITLLITGCILYIYKYYDLKKDIKGKTKLSFESVLEKISIVNNDFGKTIYKTWLSPNKYNLKKVEFNNEIVLESKLVIGLPVEIEVSAHANYPLNMKILDSNTLVNRSDVEKALKKLNEI